jgi:hypothetical protein
MYVSVILYSFAPFDLGLLTQVVDCSDANDLYILSREDISCHVMFPAPSGQDLQLWQPRRSRIVEVPIINSKFNLCQFTFISFLVITKCIDEMIWGENVLIKLHHSICSAQALGRLPFLPDPQIFIIVFVKPERKQSIFLNWCSK